MQTAGTVENVTLAKPHFCTDYEKARGGVEGGEESLVETG